MSFTSELLPEPETPVTHTKTPSGISTSMFLRLWCRAPRTTSLLRADRAADGGNLDLPPAGKIGPGEAGRDLHDSAGRPGGHHVPAAHARAGPEIHDVVGRPHRVFVVLDDHHRVALVAELGQGVQQAVVVAGVQADRRLVENVEHAHQAAADLPGQADPLHFAAGERGGGAVQREIIEAHVLEEPQPAANFLQRFGGDGLLRGDRDPAPRRNVPRR